MPSFRSFSADWRRPAWALLLVAASLAFSLALACAMPFAALCAVAVCTLPRRDAFYTVGAAWIANQAIGFSFLHYPWDANCFAWGVAIGLSALLCTLAAHWARQRSIHHRPLMSGLAAFVAAFVVLELALASSAVFLGGIGSFTPRILAIVFGLDSLACVALFALSWVAALVGVAQPSPSLARTTA